MLQNSPSISILHFNHESTIHFKTVIVADDVRMQTKLGQHFGL